ncbi:MAG: (2Fe-2S) ferredoxin domain-containing protein [Clostridia bacterium]|nr:(2Fe-2S) ferredoxin domain-containing protein [Clostridia bacterium]
MKSLEELMAIRDNTKAKIMMDADPSAYRVVVGMATCGIAAGATPVLEALKECAEKEGVSNVTVSQTGCIGICQYEPIVEVHQKGKEKVTYVKMNAEKAKEVFERHIKGGEPVIEYTIGKVLS